jgi:hyperosmotically inducible protein
MTLKRIFIAVMLVASFMTAGFAGSKNTSDDFLIDTIRQKLASDQVVKGGAIDVQVHEGAVVLAGKVESEKQKDRAEKLAKRVNGVKSVKNDIQLAH